jgi:hypothetical protein
MLIAAGMLVAGVMRRFPSLPLSSFCSDCTIELDMTTTGSSGVYSGNASGDDKPGSGRAFRACVVAAKAMALSDTIATLFLSSPYCLLHNVSN